MLFSNNVSSVAVVCIEAIGRDPCAVSLNPGKFLSWSDRGSMEQRWEDQKTRVGGYWAAGTCRVVRGCRKFVHSPLWGSGSGEQPACSGGPGCNGFEKLC